MKAQARRVQSMSLADRMCRERLCFDSVCSNSCVDNCGSHIRSRHSTRRNYIRGIRNSYCTVDTSMDVQT